MTHWNYKRNEETKVNVKIYENDVWTKVTCWMRFRINIKHNLVFPENFHISDKNRKSRNPLVLLVETHNALQLPVFFFFFLRSIFKKEYMTKLTEKHKIN